MDRVYVKHFTARKLKYLSTNIAGRLEKDFKTLPFRWPKHSFSAALKRLLTVLVLYPPGRQRSAVLLPTIEALIMHSRSISLKIYLRQARVCALDKRKSLTYVSRR